MAYNVYKFTPSHTDEFQPQDMQRESWNLYQKLCETGFEEWLEDRRRSISLEVDGNIVAIMGVLPLENGGGHLWLFNEKRVGANELRLVTKCVLGALEGLKDVGYTWVQTPIREDFEEGVRWAKLLGFTPTGKVEDLMENDIEFRYWKKVL